MAASHGEQWHHDEQPDQEPVAEGTGLGLDVGERRTAMRWRGVPGAAGVLGGRVRRVSGGAVMGSSLCSGATGGGSLRAGDYAYVTVTYEYVGYARGWLRFHQEVVYVTLRDASVSHIMGQVAQRAMATVVRRAVGGAWLPGEDSNLG